eukprot:TRINITY_DN19680_c0_g1_i2.p1 TRINITY_DN19680_c0_g1~~TRINITY_DN19680_c0_g1_i2.p1  ORF type:complete len:188 (+),score=43.26 TRINITY_DN19680_c0_g1_i2:320-883(+)
MLKRTVCVADPKQISFLEASLDAEDFEELLSQDVTLALAHAQQRATALAGQLIHAHKLSCLYFEECVRCKATEVCKIESTLNEEKEARKGIVDELSQQHETIASLMDIGPEWFSDTPAVRSNEDHRLQIALQQANADRAFYKAALEEAEREQANLSQYTNNVVQYSCLLYTSPSPRDRTRSRMPSSA